MNICFTLIYLFSQFELVKKIGHMQTNLGKNRHLGFISLEIHPTHKHVGNKCKYDKDSTNITQ